jgi:hypothetical protein
MSAPVLLYKIREAALRFSVLDITTGSAHGTILGTFTKTLKVAS